MRKLIVTIVVFAVLGGLAYGGYRYWASRGSVVPEFRTATVTRGELLATISATGTVEPEEVIDVGAQVAGQILSFGKDAQGKPVDYGSRIQEGMVLAQIDDSTYQADFAQSQAAVAQAKAQVAQAQSGIAKAEADYKQIAAKADQATRDWERAQKLGPSDALSQASYDTYRGTYETAQANLGVGLAAIDQAKAALPQAQAQQASAEAGLSRSKRNLSYTVIKSPVNGVIIDRRVNIGQTVVASLNAPSLFLIAKDLTRIQVWVAVNEADIGSIHPGQPVTFTADALPGRTFTGQVNKVRLNAQMTQNVVTYTVEVAADNSDGQLLPYLTASVQFEVSRHPDVLMVPNTALRYTPAPQYVVADAGGGAGANQQQGRRRGQQAQEGNEPPARGSGDAEAGPSTRRSRAGAGGGEGDASGSRGGRGTLWVKDASGQLKPIQVRTGMSDGAMTEVTGKDVSEGMEIVIGEQRNDVAAAPGTPASPFTPQFGRGRGR